MRTFISTSLAATALAATVALSLAAAPAAVAAPAGSSFGSAGSLGTSNIGLGPAMKVGQEGLTISAWFPGRDDAECRAHAAPLHLLPAALDGGDGAIPLDIETGDRQGRAALLPGPGVYVVAGQCPGTGPTVAAVLAPLDVGANPLGSAAGSLLMGSSMFGSLGSLGY